MNSKKIDAAVAAAKEFIRRAQAYKEASKPVPGGNGHEWYPMAPLS